MATTMASTMATTFHQFPDLPRELRDEIWRFTIRPPVSGVNIFRFHRFWEKIPPGTPVIASLANCSHQHRLSAASPEQYFKSIDTNCADKDVSSYLIDSGLWAACKESRLVMEKQFAHCSSRCWHQDFRAARPNTLAGKMCQGGLSRPERRRFSGDSHYCFTLFPRGDLLVLQGDKMDVTANLECITHIWPERSSHGAFRNIAIEYDPEWGVELDKALRDDDDYPPIVENLVEISQECVYLMIWVVDHNLKRRQNARDVPAVGEFAPDRKDRHATFYASDRKFVQVNCRQGAKAFDYWEYIKPVGDGGYEKSSISFAKELTKLFENFADREDGVVSHVSCYFGFLGWDNL